MRHYSSAFLALLVGSGAALAQTPAEILSTIELHPDFAIELVAMEPQVFDPVDLEFDELGRMFVVEMSGYPFPDGTGKIALLEDKDGDGVYESRTVFAENFDAAESILPYRGGLLVASPPQLLFLKDTDGDNVADVRETWLDGFDLENTQHNYNGLTYGLDNWIYGASGGNSGEVFWPNKPDEKTPLARSDFRIDFDARRFELYGHSSGGFGLTMDDYGRIFTTHNTQHIFQFVFAGRYLESLPAGRRGTLDYISDHDEGGLARIYAIGEQETRVNHPEQSGFFSGGCGITFYGGEAFPEGFNDNVFVCDVVLNLVHRDVIAPNGAGFTASRGRPKVEFLASTDRAFRPVNLSVGPDGSLYLLDMHRTVIEHPEWIPDELEEKMDINAGKDRGRIFRITPKAGLPPAAPVTFDRNDLPSVIEQLGDANQWRRMTAQRLLVEWKDPASVPLLHAAAQAGGDPLKQLHALWTLEGLDALTAADVAAGLAAADPGVQENALQLAELLFQLDIDTAQKVASLATSPSPRVRMQTALTLGVLRSRNAIDATTTIAALMAIAGQDVGDHWTRWAVVSAGQYDPLTLLQTALADEPLRENPATPELLAPLAQIAAASQPENALAMINAVSSADAPPDALVASVLNGLADGLPSGATGGDATANAIDKLLHNESPVVIAAAWRVSSALALPVSTRQQALLNDAREAVVDSTQDTESRLHALGLLAFAPYGDRIELLFDLLDTRQPRTLQTAAMDQIRQGADESIALRLLDVWTGLGPDTRSMASDLLIRNRQFHDILLTALESGRLPIGQMNFDLERRRALLFWSTDEVKARAEKLFTDAGVVTRQAALDKMKPALELAGDAKRGHAVYQENCMKCHQIGEEGFNVGPNLTEIGRKSKETLLHDILDPNAAADTQYLSYAIVAGDGGFESGEIVTGIIVDESDTAVVLREAGGNERTFEKSKIEEMRATGLSLMPEELENTVSPQAMADLLAFLQMPR